MTKFIAKFAYAENDRSIQMAGLADDQFDAKDYVLFQKSCNPSNDDIRLGHDKIHTSVSGKGGAYGGIESLELFNDRLRLIVSRDVAELLASDVEIVVVFDPNTKNLQPLSEALAQMAGSCFVDRRVI